MAVRAAAGFDRFWLVLLTLPPLLIFPNLGNVTLWQDEAETALLARSVLRHGVPVAHDGRRVISDQPGSPDVNDGGLWIWTPWLQLYATAASFALFGESATTARLPFALAGCGAILASYGLLRALATRVFTARVAVLLLLSSVPYLLQLRQSRYYAFVPLFTMLHLWGYLRLVRHQRGGAALFAGAGLGLYHTLLPQLVASTLATGIDALALRRDARLGRAVIALSAAVAALSLPFFWYTEGWSRAYLDQGHGFDSVTRYLATLRTYLVAIHLYSWPFLWLAPALWLSRSRLRLELPRLGWAALLAAVSGWTLAATAAPSRASLAVLVGVTLALAGAGVVWALQRRQRGEQRLFLRDGAAAIALSIGVGVALHAATATVPFFRYLVGLLPLLALASAVTLELLARGRGSVVLALVLALALVDGIQRLPFFLGNALHRAAGTLDAEALQREMPLDDGLASSNAFEMLAQDDNGFPRNRWLLDYVGELLHDYDGPVEAALESLAEHAAPDDIVLVRYEHFPLMYYTDLRVVRWDEAGSLERLPDWIFDHGFNPLPPDPRIVHARERYERVALQAREDLWENSPEPHRHRFRTRTRGEPVRLYRLAEGASSAFPQAAETP